MRTAASICCVIVLSSVACAKSDDPEEAYEGSTESGGTSMSMSTGSPGMTTTSGNNSSMSSSTSTSATGGTVSANGASAGGSMQASSTSVTGTGTGGGGGMSSTGRMSTTVSSGSGGATTGEGTGSGGGPTTGGQATCESGPLDAPLPDCSPVPVPDTGDYYADCVARINQFRWECQCLPPLDRWEEGEDCADQHAEYDYQQDMAHAGIRANICEPGNAAQNECPDYGPNFGIVDFCLQQMWDEGPGEPFEAHGHYINMSNPSFSRVACGIYITPEGNTWAVQNFQ